MRKFIPLATLSLLFLGTTASFPAAVQQSSPVNHSALLLEDFQNRVAQYVKLHKQIAALLPALKPTDSAARLTRHQRLLAEKIRAARKGAKQGDIFSPEISVEFKRLIRLAMRGRGAQRIRSSLRVAERLHQRVSVNEPYPKTAPLGTTPPTLLLNLPKLPPELDYRVVGRDLILRDVGADLVVDLIPAAIP